MSHSRSILASLLALAACADDRPLEPVVDSPDAPGSAFITAASVSVVMSDLNSPRGLAWGPEGALYVAEAGTTNSTGVCVPFLDGPRSLTKCLSGTGSISRLWKGQQQRVQRAASLPLSSSRKGSPPVPTIFRLSGEEMLTCPLAGALTLLSVMSWAKWGPLPERW